MAPSARFSSEQILTTSAVPTSPAAPSRSGCFMRRAAAGPLRVSFSTLPAQVEQLESRELLTVTFQGGAVLTNVQVQNVYLGSDWSGKALQNQAAQLDKFDSMLVQSPFMDGMTLAGYNVYRGSASP